MSEAKVSQEGSTFNHVGRDQYNYYGSNGDCQRSDETANCRQHNFTPSAMPFIISHFLALFELNNYVQTIYRDSSVLTWETTYTGPPHSGHWLAIARSKHNKICMDTDVDRRCQTVQSVEFGRGAGKTKAVAKQLAAREALLAHRGS